MMASGFVPSTIVGRMRCVTRRLERALLAGQECVDRQESGHRRDVVQDPDAAGHGRPAELHREEQDQQQPPPEDRHRIAGERHAHDAVVEYRVASHGGDHARRNADDEREQDRAGGELDGRGEQRGELAHHRLLRDHRLAEVPVQHAADIDAVLDEHGPVEPVFLEQRRMPGGIDAALARHGLDRIARHDPDQEEGEQRHADEGRDDEADSAQQEAQHLGIGRRWTAARALAARLAAQEC